MIHLEYIDFQKGVNHDMKNHITKAIAVLMAVIMLMSVAPTAALAELLPQTQAPYDYNGDGVIDAADDDIFASVTQGKTVTGTSYNAAMGYWDTDGYYYDTDDGGKVRIVNSSYSPYEPVSTSDDNHPFIQDGAAWIDLSKIYYGAPATPNYPITAWSANTSVVNVTGTGDTYSADLKYTVKNTTTGETFEYKAPVAGEEIYALPDMNLIDEYTWASFTAVVDHETNEEQNGVINSADKPTYFVAEGETKTDISGELPYKTPNSHSITSKNADTTAYAYNRYDAMQGKWGLTLDKNVSSVAWTPSWRDGYYGTGTGTDGNPAKVSLNNSLLYLSDTPYLYYSTEALEGTQIAISLLIGTPVQSEYKTTKVTNDKAASNKDFLQTYVTEKEYDKSTGQAATTATYDSNRVVEYVYRWYTITDDSDRPGIVGDNVDMEASMVPNVHISDPVMIGNLKVDNNTSNILSAILNGYDTVGYGLSAQTSGNADLLDPIKVAQRDGVTDTDTLFVNGSITGCIDFTTVLPLLMGVLDGESDTEDGGRGDVEYKIAQVRVDTKTDDSVENAQDSAARINYLYFGPGQSMVYTPQSTVGAEVNAANWQYAQNVIKIGDDALGGGYNEGDANNVAQNYHNTKFESTTYDAGYTNGWENGEAVSITNTPNDPQLITIDTYGDGTGQLKDVEYETYTDKSGNTWRYPMNYAVGNDVSAKGDTYITGGTGDHSKLWVVNINGEKKTFEAEYNEDDGKYYIMVTLPIRKWVNVLGNSRKLSMTITVDEYGRENTENQVPGLVLWGNKSGAVGAGHSVTSTRFRNEEILAVFGDDTYYQVDNGDDYATVLIDEALGLSTFYNNDSYVTLYHRPNKAKQDYTIVAVENLQVLVDAEGTYYYKQVVNGQAYYYTAVQERGSNGTTLLYFNENEVVDDATKWPTYEYDPDTGVTYDGGGNVVTYSPEVLTPLYALSGVTEAELPAELTAVKDSEETWADLLRSPYMYNNLVKGAWNVKGYGTEMAGYVFVTSLRFAVPIGAKFTVQNMKGDDNSAGLNMYSTSGSVVNAYDGGTGVQPEINVSNTQSEMTVTKSGDTYSTPASYGDGSIKGTQSESAAAYGPYLTESYYTIYNILDTESLNASSGAETEQTLYGQSTTILDDSGLTVYSIPYGPWCDKNKVGTFTVTAEQNANTANKVAYTSHSYGYAPDNNNVVVYGVIKFTDDKYRDNYIDESYWGLVGVRTGNGADFGWIKLAGSLADGDTTLGWNVTAFDVTSASSNKRLAFVETKHSQDYVSTTYLNTLYAKLNNEWMFSNFKETTKGYYTQYGGTASTYGDGKKGVEGEDLYHPYGYPIPMYANETRAAADNNGPTNLDDVAIKATNTTDMKFTVTPGSNDYWRVGSISRTLSTPITLSRQQKGTEVTYPVLYYDYSGLKITNRTSGVTADGAVRVAITVRVNNSDTQLIYLNGAGALTDVSGTQNADGTWSDATGHYGDQCGYYSFKELMTTYTTVQIVGMHLQYSYSSEYSTAEMVIRRFEIWQDEQEWLDKIMNTSGVANTWNTDMKASVADGFNIINDAYYNVDDSSTTNKKENSNKGWSAELRLDTNRDGNLTTADAVYDSSEPSRDGVYQYLTSLGHLRVWVPGKSEASISFKSDRSFNTNNYKYLYYSYSVRDTQSGIAAADPTKVPGITVAIKSQQANSDSAYLQQNGSWVYYAPDNPCWSTGGADNREFTTTMNAALDLSTLDGIDSVNQIVFYMNNLNNSPTAEFYINYVVLSNMEPTAVVKDAINAPHIQYYYLMDATGDRYSARFPTLDNPDGGVTGDDANSSRVNPIVVTRGDLLEEGTYFNGESLKSYTGVENDYEYNHGKTDANDILKEIWFYDGQNTDEDDDITDYYSYRDRERLNTVNGEVVRTEPDGIGNIYDMLWSYGRWFTGEGESYLNMMYVSDPDAPTKSNETADAVSGNLTRRYATENYVLLRSGIQPKTYTTYYSAGEDGQFYYEGYSEVADEVSNVNTDNSYYITETVLLSYYNRPTDVLDENNDGKKDIIEPVRYGYTFAGWKKNDETTTLETLHRYDRKTVPGVDYYVAQWTPNTDAYPDPFKATFYNGVAADGSAVAWETNDSGYTVWNTVGSKWVERSVQVGVTGGKNNSLKITVPTTAQMWTANGNMTVAGWYAYTDEACTDPYLITNPETGEKDLHAVYASASTITLKRDLYFAPILVEQGDESERLLTVTVTGATLKLAILDENGNLTATNEPYKQGIGYKETEDGSLVYYNIPKNLIMIAYPTDEMKAKAAEEGATYVWTAPYDIDGTILASDGSAVLSTNEESYIFAATTKRVINFESAVANTTDTVGNVTTFQDAVVANRQMTFTSQFEDIEGYDAVAWGTMYLVGVQNPSKPENYINFMKLDEGTINEASVEMGSYATLLTSVKKIQATGKSRTNQFALSYTASVDNTRTIWMRGYVIYRNTTDGTYHVTYSKYIVQRTVEAYQAPTTETA